MSFTSYVTAQQAERPNVIFILMDDMGFSDVSSYGSTVVDTPRIDQLASQGLKFTDFHTGASICSPSRAAFLTGRYPQRAGSEHGINLNREPHWFLGLNPNEITLAEMFKNRGYSTHMIGKWHLGNELRFHPMNQGFDTYYGAPNNFGHDTQFFDGHQLVFQNTPLAQLTSLYTARAKDIINSHTDEPFFLYYSHNYPHTPYQAGVDFRGSSDDGVRGDVIEEIDWSIGQVIDTLSQTPGLLENTLIIFTSDNGPTNNRYALPYRGRKFNSLEGGHRVPFILYWKDRIVRPTETSLPVNAMDLFPTISQLIGEPMPADREYDGTSLVPLLDDSSITRNADAPFYYYNGGNLQAIRTGDWKLHLSRTLPEAPWWDDQRNATGLSQRLYNLANDEGEANDVQGMNPDVVNSLQVLAAEAESKLGTHFTTGSEQHPAGNLFPEVPAVTNPAVWDAFSDEVQGAGRLYFNNARFRQQFPDEFFSTAQVSVEPVGDGSDYDEVGAAATGFRSTSIVKNFDVGVSGLADNVYGSDGYFFFGQGGTTNINQQPFSLNSSQSTRQNFFWQATVGDNFGNVSEWTNRSRFDNPSLPVGDTVADRTATGIGTAAATEGGEWGEILDFVVHGNAPFEFRLGVVAGNATTNDHRWDPTGIRISVNGNPPVAVTNLSPRVDDVGIVFFDIKITEGTLVTVSVQGQTRGGEGVVISGSSIAGLTLDVVADSVHGILLGDVNRDGTVNFLDISPFIGLLSTGGYQIEADINENGVVDFLDISPFIALLSSQR